MTETLVVCAGCYRRVRSSERVNRTRRRLSRP